MKVLIIGGTGTLSSDCVKLSLEQGNETYVLNRGNRELPQGAKPLKFDFRGTAQNKLERFMNDKEFDVIADFLTYNAQDMERNVNVFQNKTKQYIFISTASMISKPVKNYLFDEQGDVGRNLSAYSYNKFEAEKVLKGQSKLNYTIVRPSYTYDLLNVPVSYGNAKNTWPVIDRMLKGKKVIIHGDGTGLWCFTNSRDFARGFNGLFLNEAAYGETINITSDEVITWQYLYETIAKALNVELNAVYVSSDNINKFDSALGGSLLSDKMHVFIPSTEKLKRIVSGYRSQISIEQGIKETIDHIMATPTCQIEDIEYDSRCDSIINKLENLIDEIDNI